MPKHKGYPDRPPDVDAATFKLWQEPEGDWKPDALLTIDGDAGELMHESRLHHNPFNDYELLIISKTNKEGKVMMAAKLKRPEGSTSLTAKPTTWLTMDEYHEKIIELEYGLRLVGFIDDPQITPGKHYNIYISKRATEHE